MKRNLLLLMAAFGLLFSSSLLNPTYGQTTISCFPYVQDFDDWATCAGQCGQACTLQDGWFNATTGDNQDWQTWTSNTPSGSTGPTGDHTSGSGNYIYYEASSPCNGGDDSAFVETPILDLTGLTDFTMAYWRHLYGQSMGTLHIDLRTYTGANPNPWQRDIVPPFTNNLNAWEADTVNLNAYVGQTIQIRFRAISGTNFYSDMSLDDIEFYTSLSLDASVSNIDQPSGAVSVGVQNVDVSVTNYGSTTLTSGTINWILNGVPQTPFAWTGNLTTNQTQSNITIGTANIPAGNSTLTAWISNPNGSTDVQPCNDTASVSLCTAYRGVFSVGAGQQFTSPLDAFNQLAICGVDSHVVLNVLPATYTERVIVGNIPGAADTATITLDGADTSLVTITNGNLATVQFDNGSWVTIKNVTIENTATSNGYGVQFRNQSDHNTIDSCCIMVATGTTSLLSPVCWSSSETSPAGSGTNGEWNTVSNNHLVNGYYGVRVQGDLNNHQDGNRVIGNTFEDTYYYCVYAQYQDSMDIIGNVCGWNPSNIQADGMYILDSEGSWIMENDISDAPDYGLYISDGNFDQAPTRRIRVINNFISSSTDRALYFDDVNNSDVIHNTTYGTYGFYYNDVDSMVVLNNIFVGSTLYAVYSLDAFTVQPSVMIDYNDYWGVGGTPIAYYGGTIFPTLVAWQAGVPPWNMNSLEGNPDFANGLQDLHVLGPLVNDQGTNSVGITIDIDGDARPFAPSINPDMGADEFFLPPLDAGITALDAPNSPLTPGLQNVEVTIRNFGTDTLTSATINWEVNQVAQTPFSWTGSLAVGQTQSNVNIGQFNFPVGTTDLCFWTTAPNGGTDGDNSNDTLCSSGCTGLMGTYTVGSGQTYPDLRAAFDDIEMCGVGGPVLLDVSAGTYTGDLNIGQFPGGSATNIVTVDGGDTSLVTLTHGTAAEPTIHLEGADWIVFKNMTIEHTGTTNAYAIQFSDSADHNMIDSCHVRVNPSTSSLFSPISFSNTRTSPAASGLNGNYNVISNNCIENGYYGVRIQGDVNNHQSGNMLIDNEFFDPYFYNIYIQYQDSVEVWGNDADQTIQAGGDGLYMLDCENFIIEENDFSDMADYGVYISDGNFDIPATRRGRVVNNFISSNTDRALYFDDVNETDVFHNTCVGTYGLYTNDIIDVDIRNNIFVGTSINAYYSLDAFGTLSNCVIDYNVFYKDGAPNLARGGATQYVDLPTWQAAFPAYNGASVEGNPVFAGGLADLHAIGGAANDVGDNSVGVTIDIDGDARPQSPSTTVDIGADEYTPLLNDATLVELIQPNSTQCGDSMTPVCVSITNLGQSPITSLPITVNVTGDIVQTFNATYTDTLDFLETDTVCVGDLNTYAGYQNVDFDGYVALSGDQNTLNDTVNPLGSSTFIPVVPQGFANSGCGSDSGSVLEGENWAGVSYAWYANANDTTPISVGPTFQIPSLAAQSTYYLGYESGASDSLTTGFPGGNGQAGNMFDVSANQSTTINGIAGNFNTGNNVVDVWYRTDSYTNSPNNANGWMPLVQGASLTSPGNGAGTLIPGTYSVTIPAGGTYGFLVICTTGGVAYTNGTAVGNVWATDGRLTIFEGLGRGVPAFTGATFSPRNFNGTLYYGSDPCSNIRIPLTGILGTAASVNLGADVSTCDTLALLDAGNPAGTVSYDWSNGDSTQTTFALSTGSYYVDIVDTAGCPASDTVNVTLNPPPTIPLAAADTICLGDSITLDAGNPGGQYLWSNSATTQTITVPGGTYSVTVVDSNICQNSATIVVTESGVAIDLGPDTTLCNGASLNLDAGPGGDSYVWTPTGDTTQAINVNTAGTYSVSATDSLNCTTSDDIIINTDVTPTAAFTFLVSGAGLTYDFTYTGTAGINYVWDFGDNSPAGSGANPSHTYAMDGSYTVCLTADNDCGLDSICQVISVVAIDRGLQAETVSLFPNPNNGQFTLSFTSYDITDVDVEIFSMRGKSVWRKGYESVNGTVEEDVTLKDVSSGVYFVRFSSANQVITRKLTVE